MSDPIVGTAIPPWIMDSIKPALSAIGALTVYGWWQGGKIPFMKSKKIETKRASDEVLIKLLDLYEKQTDTLERIVNKLNEHNEGFRNHQETETAILEKIEIAVAALCLALKTRSHSGV